MRPHPLPADPARRPVRDVARVLRHRAGAFPERLPVQSVMLEQVMNRGKGSILSSGFFVKQLSVDGGILYARGNKNIDFLVRPGQTIYQEVTDMVITNISEAKAQLSALVEKVMAGQEVIIGKAGKPVAKLVRYEQKEKPRRSGALRGKIKIAGDFDELPEDIAGAFGMVDK